MNRGLPDDIAFGRHPAETILKNPEATIDRIWVQQDVHFPDAFRSVLFAVKKRGIKLNFVDKKTLDRLTNGAVHQGIVIRMMVCRPIDYEDLLNMPDVSEHRCFMVLDHIQDPRNLGAVFRSAAAAGIHGILLPRHASAPLSGVAMKASAGTLSQVPVALIGNLAAALRDLKSRNFWIVGVSHDGTTVLDSSTFPERTVFILGGEDTGLRPVLRKECDDVRAIPMRGPAGSLNVSVAAGIVLYEWVRTRMGRTR
mgnify:CR=1 FL=1